MQKNSVLAELRFEQILWSLICALLDHLFAFPEIVFVFTIDFPAPSKLSLVVMSLHVKKHVPLLSIFSHVLCPVLSNVYNHSKKTLQMFGWVYSLFQPVHVYGTVAVRDLRIHH